MPADRALLDTGVLVAFLHAGDEAHDAAVDVLRARRGVLLTTPAVLTEAMFLLGRTRGGPEACLDFFLRDGAHLVPSSRAALARCRTLLREYEDLPADFADATLVALAEDTETWTVLTLDRRDFSVYRGRGGQRFEIRPGPPGSEAEPAPRDPPRPEERTTPRGIDAPAHPPGSTPP